MSLLRYHVVTLTEGGAEFDDYTSPEDVRIAVNKWFTKKNEAAARRALRTAELGDEIALDGCAVCYVLKMKPKRVIR